MAATEGAEATAGKELVEQLRRERLFDIESRLVPCRRRAFLVLSVALLAAGPWLGWWWMVPLALAATAFAVTDWILPRSRRPEAVVAAGWAIAPLMIAVSVALTGAGSSPALAWFALPAITLATRFERRGVLLGSAYIGVLLLLSTLALEPGATLADPSMVIFAAALIAATLIFVHAVIDSDREHRRSSVIDPLTGLLNRAALAQHVDDVRRGQGGAAGARSLGLLIGDLDNFKRINDAHGHAAGDAVLRDAAYAIRGALRSLDGAYRLGGEEFLILLPGADETGLRDVGERLRLAVRGCSRPGIEVSISLGGAVAEIGELDFSALSAAADGALYDAKSSGRDRLCVHRGGLPSEIGSADPTPPRPQLARRPQPAE